MPLSAIPFPVALDIRHTAPGSSRNYRDTVDHYLCQHQDGIKYQKTNHPFTYGRYEHFLEEHLYIDYSSPPIQALARELFSGIDSTLEKVKVAYEFVRDEIPHSFDIGSDAIVSRASDVLAEKTGICHSKANLLAALLRGVGIPTEFCYQHITLAGDDSLGYCVHCYNAIFVNDRWIFLDARGNTNSRRALFSPENPVLAYRNRSEYDE